MTNKIKILISAGVIFLITVAVFGYAFFEKKRTEMLRQAGEQQIVDKGNANSANISKQGSDNLSENPSFSQITDASKEEIKKMVEKSDKIANLSEEEKSRIVENIKESIMNREPLTGTFQGKIMFITGESIVVGNEDARYAISAKIDSKTPVYLEGDSALKKLSFLAVGDLVSIDVKDDNSVKIVKVK